MLRKISIDSLMPYFGVVLLIIAGSFFFPQVLSADYLAQQLQIAAFLGTTYTEGNVMFAVAAVVSAAVPLFLLVMIFQRQIVSGLTAGAVKG